MWNRAVLLMAGMAFGWSLVNYWAAPPKETRRHLVRMLLGLAVAVALVISLGLNNRSTIGASIVVFLLSALVAYAGNAKQVAKEIERGPLARPLRPAHNLDRTALILVLDAEPKTYDGASFWAQQIRHEPPAEGPGKNWFTLPLAFSRIRKAYQAMDNQSPLHTSAASTRNELQRRLGTDFLVEIAFLRTTPFVDTTLVQLTEQGYTRMVLVPVALDNAASRAVRSHVVRSRIREQGVAVIYTDPIAAELARSVQERIAILAMGQVPISAFSFDTELLNGIEQAFAAVEA